LGAAVDLTGQDGAEVGAAQDVADVEAQGREQPGHAAADEEGGERPGRSPRPARRGFGSVAGHAWVPPARPAARPGPCVWDGPSPPGRHLARRAGGVPDRLRGGRNSAVLSQKKKVVFTCSSSPGARPGRPGWPTQAGPTRGRTYSDRGRSSN